MSKLVQTPSDKAAISDFLGDGNVSSVPAVQASDINDGDILNQTSTVDMGNGYKFVITLPSGRSLESAPVGNDYNKRDAAMQWVEAVRQSIVGDAQQAAESAMRANRAADFAEDTSGQAMECTPVGGEPRPSVSAVRSEPVPSSDPVEYAKAQLADALRRLAALSGATQDVAKWQKVVNSLTGGSTKTKKRRRKKKVVKL